MTQLNTMESQLMIDRKALNRLFDDAIDELEVTYDVYFEIERYRRRCVHVVNHLLSNGIRQGKILVLGSNEKPFSMLFEKLGFQVKCFSPHGNMQDENEVGGWTGTSTLQDIRDLAGEYDIVICDDILQYFASPAETLTVIKDHLRPGGLLTVTTPNIARASARLRLLRGRNVYPWLSGDVSLEDDVEQLKPYREYTLCELDMIMNNVGLELMKSEFIIGKNVNANTWPPMPLKEYVIQKISFVVQKIVAPFRNYLFVMGRKPL